MDPVRQIFSHVLPRLEIAQAEFEIFHLIQVLLAQYLVLLNFLSFAKINQSLLVELLLQLSDQVMQAD